VIEQEFARILDEYRWRLFWVKHLNPIGLALYLGRNR